MTPSVDPGAAARPPPRVRRCCIAMLCLAALCIASPARSACDLSDGGKARVARVIDGETLELADGRTVRLIGALAPGTPDWWKKAEPWPPADRARAALADLLLDREVELRHGGTKEDRHGRLLAHLFTERGPERLWAQSALVERGLARAYSLADNRACMAELLARETEARTARRGIWRRKTYRVMAASEPSRLMSRLQTFQLVSGRVLAIKTTKSWTYVNFSRDWKRDFTIAIRARDRSRFAEPETLPDRLTGRMVRVRGWLESWNGPVIKATHPEQIEILPEVPAPPSRK